MFTFNKLTIAILVLVFQVCFSQLPLPLNRPDGNPRLLRQPESGSSPPSLPLPKPPRRPDRSNVDHVAEESANLPPEPYNFAYNVKDEYGNTQYRKEEGDGKGTVRGTFGYTDARGLFRFVEYVADAFGFRANIRSNEPGIANAPSADTTLLAEETPRGIYETAASDSKPIKAQRDELPDAGSRVRVPKNVYAILGNKPAASGRVQYVVAGPVTTSSSTTASDDSASN